MVAAGFAAGLAAVLAAASACQPAQKDDLAGGGLDVRWEIAPSPARVGPAHLRFDFTDAKGQPADVKALEVEATMSHPGMVPEIATAQAGAPGHFEADLELTMGGDWTLLLRGQRADGSSFQLERDLLGVSSK